MSNFITEDDLFSISNDEYGWVITHKKSGKSMGASYNLVPKDSSADYILGYAKCVAHMEGWLKA